MVDVDKIKRDLYKNFEVDGSVKIDPSTGVVDVDGDVYLIKPISHLPVKFGTVRGSFYCGDNQLTNLEGAPRHVGGYFNGCRNRLTSLEGAPDHVGEDFDCYDNQLTNLEGAPNHVGGDFNCAHSPLISLKGAPDHVGKFWCSYAKSLPLMRLLVYPMVEIYGAPPRLEDIINKYTGQGKPGALKAAVELIRAGYKENARW